MRSEALRLVGADCNHVDEFMAECPKGGAVKLFSLALELAWRLGNVFCRNAHGCKSENVLHSRGFPDAGPRLNHHLCCAEVPSVATSPTVLSSRHSFLEIAGS